jgi:AcrR family transcriptional regulator
VPPAGLRERKKARTRETIQRHALTLFAEHGYRETTVEQIAEAAEVSPSTFFRYFKTKEDAVLSEFIDSRVIDLVRTAPRELGPVAALRYAMTNMWQSMTTAEFELELKRNQLIATVPELQRGMLEEIVRPMRLLAGAFAARLGRPVDDERIRVYAGAVVGAMVALGMTDDPSAADFERMVSGLDLIEDVVRLD